ncbi:preprotein translocase subunit SecA [Teredinibacter haidensis]|uniref:preprotein translocase subunit SecA n=1 Tax=Teredinibacter haidensis TaxID=2731755 RepID=UPI000948A8C5|nr:preprotein translocase subunit SecA [Teredinibacter haidensis]
MLGKLARAVFGSKNDRELKKMGKVVQRINALESDMEALNDEQLKAKTAEYRERYEKGETLDQLLPEAFATAREASRRAMGMRHFDVQLIGGMTLHQGHISEMKTGEGKTLVATLAAYLNAIPSKGVHIVTVNDYLARRDSNWMRPAYEALGMTVGSIVSMQDQQEKYDAYRADITYGTNNEYGFDYLRDNMALRQEDRMQRPLFFAVVDEVDSILIDEARTPLIISGAVEDSSLLYQKINTLIPKLKLQPEVAEGEENTEIGHFTIDEKLRSVELTEDGHQLVEELLIKEGLLKEDESLYQASNLKLVHHIQSGLRAHHLYQRNVEYILQDNQVVLIDEHTGRTMSGRRLSEGLHQAIEAKEGVSIQAESQTMASTTFQNYFRLYPTLSGMTGTADTEAFEFRQIYGLNVVVIPTNRPVSRQDLNDLIFLNMEDKYDAIIDDVKAFREKNAPVLVGTASVETSEEMSDRLTKAGIQHEVLNAKQHEREADIVAQAGRPGAVTIATNMAGRGTDIVLGGKWESEIAKLDNPSQEEIDAVKADWNLRHEMVIEAGGLHIIGTERHESRRIDNQLRGRAGRQGDPGLSRFYLSLEDNLMRIFASDRMRSIMQTLGMEKGEAIEHRMVTNAIEKAQRKVEGRNFDYRKQLLEYDDVANDQRRVIYAQRNELLDADDIEEAIAGIREDVISAQMASFIPPQSVEEQWDIAGLEKRLQDDYGISLPIQQWLDEDANLHEDSLRDRIVGAVDELYLQKAEQIGDIIRTLEKQLMLQVLDTLWKDHLQNMDSLRQGINLRAYAQRNPKQEYKRESFALFEELLETLKSDITRVLFRIQPISEEQLAEMERRRREEAEAQKMRMQQQHEEFSALTKESPEAMAQVRPERPYVRDGKKIGRNDPCPCGSGKKYKACHGKLA